jgi:hypothetical protein
MVQRDWPIGEWESPLRLRALRGGTVTEIISFLEDMETAYNALYSFDLMIFEWGRALRYPRRFVLPDELLGLLPFESRAGSLIERSEQLIPEYRLEVRRISIHSRGGPVFRNRMAAWLRWILGSITPPISPGLPA